MKKWHKDALSFGSIMLYITTITIHYKDYDRLSFLLGVIGLALAIMVKGWLDGK